MICPCGDNCPRLLIGEGRCSSHRFTTGISAAGRAQHRRTPGVASERYYAIVKLLVAAGATVKSEWLDKETVHKDPSMQGALRGA